MSSFAYSKNDGPGGISLGEEPRRVPGRAEQRREEGRPLGGVPGRQGNTPPRDEDSRDLSSRPLGLADVLDDYVPDCRIERLVGERKVRDGRLDEGSSRIAPCCDLDHGGRDIDSGRLRAALACLPGGIARSCSDVHDAQARFDARCIE